MKKVENDEQRKVVKGNEWNEKGEYPNNKYLMYNQNQYAQNNLAIGMTHIRQ